MHRHVKRFEERVVDRLQIQRFLRDPAMGPRILFFSGGSALKDLSRCLKRYTHNSVHLLTPFDSGGSSAKLRDAFDMPAVGDIRSRLVALAEESRDTRAALELVEHRLSQDASPLELILELQALLEGEHPLIQSVPPHLATLIREHLGYFEEAMPPDFDLRGACLGNLLLAGGYLHYGRRLEPCLHLFARILSVRGHVSPITQEPFHLAVELESGERLIGQHLVAGKEFRPISSPVAECGLSAKVDSWRPVSVKIDNSLCSLIEEADLIVFPPGSFYSSIIANLLVTGISQAIARSKARKVYVPNLGEDPEQFGMTLNSCVDRLVATLRLEHPDSTPATDLMTHVLVDRQLQRYAGAPELELWEKQGIALVAGDLVTNASEPFYDPARLSAMLLSLAR